MANRGNAWPLLALACAAFALCGYELWTGRVVLSDGVLEAEAPSREVTRAEDPVIFYGSLAVSGGIGLYFLVRAVRSVARES